MNGIKDAIKEAIYNSFVGSSGFSFSDVMIIIGISCLMGIYVYLIYRNFSRPEFYSKDLNITMAGMVIVTSAIMVAMQSNLIVSLGMVGALSIVRFRTAIKSPVDLLYLFWAISEGIICGVGLYMLGVVLSIIMTVLLFVLNRIPNSKTNQLLIIKINELSIQNIVDELVKKNSKYSKVVSTIVKNGECEIIYEIEPLQSSKLTSELSSIDSVITFSVVDNNGERRI